MQIKLEKVRLSFNDLFVAKAVQGGDPRFSATFLIPKDDKKQLAAIKQTLKDVAVAKWADKADTILTGLKNKGRVCVGDGDGEDYTGYEGNMFFRSSRKTRPVVVDRNKNPIAQEDGVIYSGCYVNAVVDVWAQDSKDYGKRINASLVAVQFVSGGDSFGGEVAASDNGLDDLGEDEEVQNLAVVGSDLV